MNNLFAQLTITVLLGLLCGMVVFNTSGNFSEQQDHWNVTFLNFMDSLPFVSVQKVKPNSKIPSFSSISKNSNNSMDRDWPSQTEKRIKNNVCIWFMGKPEKNTCDQIADYCEDQNLFNKVNECIMREMNISEHDLRRLSRSRWK